MTPPRSLKRRLGAALLELLHERALHVHDRFGLLVLAGRNGLPIDTKYGDYDLKMQKGSLHEVLEWLRSKVDPRESWIGYLFVSGMALAVGIALLDPSASQGLNFIERLAFWLSHATLAIAILESAQIFLGRFRLFAALPPLLLVLLGALLGAPIFSVASLLILESLLHFPSLEIGGDSITLWEVLEEIRSSSGQVLLFWILLNTPRLLIISAEQRLRGSLDHGNDNSEDDANELPIINRDLPEFLRKLPRGLGTDIVALTAELHYLRVYTSLGDALILMSFSRAVQGLAGIPGVVVHRSHWVAKEHVVQIKTQGNRTSCLLSTGLIVPVSRPNRAQISLVLDRKEAQRAVNLAQEIVKSSRTK